MAIEETDVTEEGHPQEAEAVILAEEEDIEEIPEIDIEEEEAAEGADLILETEEDTEEDLELHQTQADTADQDLAHHHQEIEEIEDLHPMTAEITLSLQDQIVLVAKLDQTDHQDQ